MARNILALFGAGKPETLSLRYLVLRRLLQATLIGIVAITSILAGTVISTILLNGWSEREAVEFTCDDTFIRHPMRRGDRGIKGMRGERGKGT